MSEPIDSSTQSVYVSARERDLDNFLLEELGASCHFCKWFLSRLEHCLDVPKHAKTAVHKNPEREITPGQTDLCLDLLDAQDATIVCVLIENKVAGGFQPDQPERYAREISAARGRLGRRRAAAVLVAPSANIAVFGNPSFDASVRLEEIVAYLHARRETLAEADDPLSVELAARLAARINLVDALINKGSYNGNWRPNPIPERRDFITRYREMASMLASRFKSTHSSSGPKAMTILFTVPKIPGLRIKNVRHNFRSDVSLVLTKAAHAKSNLDRSGLLPSGATTDVRASGTLLVRLTTEPLDPTGDRFLAQKSAIEAAIQTVNRLYDWAAVNSLRLASIIDGS